MSIAIRAVSYMIWIHLLGVGLFAFLFLVERNPSDLLSMVSTLAVMGVLYFIIMGLRREFSWVAIPFSGLCVFNIIVQMSRGLSLVSLLGFVDAVLSFVAICGIVIWLNERREVSTDRHVVD